MTFKKIIIFTVQEFNDNQEKEGYLPQSGVVINTMMLANPSTVYVSVGYSK